MARGVNKVTLIGNLGADPIVKQTTNGSTIANISIATSISWRDKQTNQIVERTEWHRVVFFNRLADIVAQYLKKGAKVYIEGSLRTRKWQDQTGADRYSTEIIANEMQMLDSLKASGEKQEHSGQADAFKPASQDNSEAEYGGQPVFEDDIPF